MHHYCKLKLVLCGATNLFFAEKPVYIHIPKGCDVEFIYKGTIVMNLIITIIEQNGFIEYRDIEWSISSIHIILFWVSTYYLYHLDLECQVILDDWSIINNWSVLFPQTLVLVR